MDAEARYAHARDLDDQLTIRAARGSSLGDLDRRAAAAKLTAREAVTPEAVQDDRAYAAMRAWLDEPSEDQLIDGERDAFGALSGQIEQRYAERQAAVITSRGVMTRLGVLDAVGREPDSDQRRALFHTLAPVWESIDSQYADLIAISRRRWQAGRSPVERNARALGMAGIEAALERILGAWRPARPVEPWDWWYASGAAARALAPAVPVERLLDVNREYFASLGASLAPVGFDVRPRPGRPPVPVAYTEFGGRADRPRPWVMATYTTGGLGELTELIHETGHAVHVAAIDTRPAFRDWPDSDAFTEALAELPALDTAEPAWQRRWLGIADDEAESIRGRYADVMLDTCWALLEIRMHASAGQDASAVWSEITSTYLGIEPHPELPWWAMRGQLFQEPGYMVNYALAAIIAADLRRAIRDHLGDWTAGNPDWYGWVSEKLLRWGRSRGSGEVLRDVLGRGPTADALIDEIRRCR